MKKLLPRTRFTGPFRPAAALLAVLALVVTMTSGVVPTPLDPPAQAADGQNPETCTNTVALANGGFEQPYIGKSTVGLRSEGEVPGWLTTATDNIIELWSDGFQNVPAHTGSQFAELNANQVSTLYQSVPTQPGQTLTWSLAHRGRNGTDTMAVEFGPPGGPYVTDRTLSDGRSWGTHSGTYVVPAGQTTTELRFRAVSAAGNVVTNGNLLDSIVFGTGACVVTSKSVLNNSRTEPTAQVGDELTYTVTATNAGGQATGNTVITDATPAGTTFVPGSLRVVTSPQSGNIGAKTDAADTDTAKFTADQVTFNVGSAATGTTGGSLLPGESVSVSFKVKVAASAADGSVVNQANVSFTGGPGTSTSNRVTTPVAPAADLAVTKLSDPTSQAAGRQVIYRATVTNNGPSTAVGVSLVDTLPAGVTYVSSAPPSGTTCTVSGQQVTCTMTSLANGESRTVPITVRIAPQVMSTMVNTVTVSSATSDLDPDNNTATAATAITTQADMSIAKTVNPTSSFAGNEVTYTLSATNAGPSTAQNVVITDTLPLGMAVISASASAGTCTTSTSSISCDMGAVAPGATPTVTVVAEISAGAEATTMLNQADVTSSTTDPDDTNNEATAMLTVARQADLSLTKTGPEQAVAGGTVTFEMVVRNNGPSDATNAALSDPVPDGLTPISMTPSQGTCTNGTCTIGSIPTGGSVTITGTYRVDAGRTAAVSNTATVSSSTPDPDSNDLTATSAVPIVTQADLVLSKTQDPATITYGEPVTYTLTVLNRGPSVATGIEITDPLPAGLTFTSSADGCTETGGTVTCPVPDLAPGENAGVSFTADTPADGSGEVRNTGTVSADTTDPVSANNTATSTANGEASADITLVKSTAPSAPVPGEALTYTLTATNNGPSAATGITVSDTLPAGITGTDVSSACALEGQQVTCTAASLGAGESVTFTIEAAIAADLRGATANTATVTSDIPNDPTPGNNTSTSTTELDPQADVAITLTPQTQTAVAGAEVELTLTVSNNGPSTARNVVATGKVPDGLTPVPGATPAGCTITDSTVTCQIGTVTPGQILDPITIKATVDHAKLPGSEITPTAQVRSTTPDTDPSNNEDSGLITVTAEADLRIAKSVQPSPVIAGDSARYTVTVTNGGLSTARGVQITDTLPVSFTVTSVNGGTGTCATGATITCTVASLAPGATATVTIVGTFDPGTSGEVTNNAEVSADTPDPDQSNNTTSLTAPVALDADLQVTKSGPEQAAAGQRIRYTVTVTNTGPSNAAAVELTDELPEGLVADSTTVTAPAGVTCSVSDGAVTCAAGDLASGASVSVTIIATVHPDLAPGTVLENTAQVTSDTPGSPDGRTSPPVQTDVTGRADISVTKLARTEAVAGGEMGYSIVVRNNGPSTARDIVIADATPAGATLADLPTGIGAECAQVDDGFRCTAATLGVGEVITVNVSYTLDSAARGRDLINTATATSTTPDPNPGDNTSTVTNTITDEAHLTIVKDGPSAPVVAGEQATFTITVTNPGPSDARNVRVQDSLPEGLTAVSMSASDGGTCNQVNLSCDWSRIPLGATRTITAVTQVGAAVANGSTLTNTATVSSATPGLEASDTADVTVTTTADLVVEKELVTADPTAGDPISWRLTVTNRGPSVATGVTVQDPAPTGVTLIEATPAQGECAIDSNDLSCAIGHVAVGEAVVVLLTGTLSAGATGEVSNTASASAEPTDPNPGNNTDEVTSDVSTRADLVLTKTATESTVVAGSAVEWTVTVRNDGPSRARDLVISDDVPAGVGDVTAALGEQECHVSDGGVVRCAVAELLTGQSVTVTVTGTLDPASTATELVNSANVSAATADPILANNTEDATMEVTAAADIQVVKSGLATAAAGSPISWTMTVRNNGPSVARAVSLADTLPAPVSAATASVAGQECPAGAPLTCSLGNLAPGASVQVRVTGMIDSAASGTITNTATARSATADTDVTNNEDAASTELTQSADVSVTKTTETSPVVPGQEVSWLATVTNNGPSDATSVEFTDAVPAEVSGVAATRVGGTSCDVTGNVVTCSLGTLEPAGSAQVRLTGTLAADYAAEELANTGTVASPVSDPDTANNSSTATATVAPEADVGVGKRIVGDVTAGDEITFEIVVTNNGPSLARAVTVTDALPDSVQDPRVDRDECTISGQAVNCTFDELGDDPVVITVTGMLAQMYGESISNTAEVSATTPDPNPTNDSATSSETVGDVAALSVTKNGPATVTAGASVTWSVVVRNGGPSDAREVILTDVFPSGISNVQSRIVGGAVCSEPGTCNLGTIPAEGAVEVLVSATIDSDIATTSLTNGVRVSTVTSERDGTDNSATATSTVQRSADLGVTKEVTPQPLVPGQDATYTLAVTNAGPSAAQHVRLTDALPAEVSIAGDLVVTGGATCAVTGNVVTCEDGQLAAGAAIKVTVPVAVSPGVTAAVRNTAVTESGTPDSNLDNNTVAIETPVAPASAMTVRKIGPETTTAGAALTWQVTVHNDGPSHAQDVVVTDILPAGTADNVTWTTSQGECAINEGLTCALGTLRAGATVQITMTLPAGTTADWTEETIENAIEVTSPTPEPGGGPGNRTDNVSTEVVRKADLRVTKTHEQDHVVPGASDTAGIATWQITATNLGPSTARDTVLTDNLPRALTDVTFTGDGVDCTAAGECQLGTLGVGESVTITVSGRLPADYGASRIRNEVRVASVDADPDPAKGQASDAIPVQPQADLVAAKTGPTEAVPGESITWTLGVRNDGPSDAASVTLTDTLPGAVTGAEVSPPTGWTCQIEAVLSCSAESPLVAGASANFEVTATIRPEATGAITNPVDVSSTTMDPDSGNNSAAVTTTLNPQADLVVTKIADKSSAVAGAAISWTITLTNEGPSRAREVRLSDAVPALVQGARVSVGERNCPAGPRAFTCTLPSLEVGAEVTVTVSGTLAPYAPAGQLVNTANVAADTPDPVSANNSAAASVPITRSANLSIMKTADPNVAVPGRDITYTLTVSNDGPSTADGAVVTDALPPGLLDPQASTDGGRCTITDGALRCELVPIGPESSVAVLLSGTIDTGAERGQLANLATVTGVTPDPDPKDNSDTVGTPIAPADLSLVKTARSDRATVGELLSWTLTATNAGPGPARNVQITDRLPGSARAVSAQSDAGACEVTDQLVSCAIGTVAAAGAVTVLVVAQVTSVASGEVTNTAAAASPDDHTAENNVAVATSTVEPKHPIPEAYPSSLPATGAELRTAIVALVLLVLGVVVRGRRRVFTRG